mmetsp:Transcript_17775/g.26633  ORF Transcript_17775/g.26633 Transcript_17775/m.26633 type:complete len:106 (-) Transcript_17775:77-394(-)
MSSSDSKIKETKESCNLQEGKTKLICQILYRKLSEYEKKKKISSWNRNYKRAYGSKCKCDICGKKTLEHTHTEIDADISGHVAEIYHYQCKNPSCGVLATRNSAY